MTYSPRRLEVSPSVPLAWSAFTPPNGAHEAQAKKSESNIKH